MRILWDILSVEINMMKALEENTLTLDIAYLVPHNLFHHPLRMFALIFLINLSVTFDIKW